MKGANLEFSGNAMNIKSKPGQTLPAKVLLIFGLTLSALPAATALAWSSIPFGDFVLNLVELPVILGVLPAAGYGLAGAAMTIFRARRRKGLAWSLTSAAFISGAIIGLIGSEKMARDGWKKVIQRSDPLIEAIHAYEKKQGEAPEKLTALVPSYLSELPSTGVGSSPRFHYLRATGTNLVMGDRWTLQVRPPQVGIGFDTLFYIPSENYPKRGYGGTIETVGRWAYVHE